MLANHGYQCFGGPLDGQMLALRPGQSVVRVHLGTDPPLRPWDDPPESVRVRTGEYRVARHATHGYVLRWQGERPDAP